MANWKKIKAEYIRGGISQRELAEKYKVSFGTLRKVAAKEKWTDLRNKTVTKTDTKMVESIAKKNVKREDRIQSVSDMLLQKIEDGISDGSLVSSAKDLKAITGALRDIREIKGSKSKLDIKEQEARIAKLQKEAKEDTVDNTIRVVLEGELDDYC